MSAGLDLFGDAITAPTTIPAKGVTNAANGRGAAISAAKTRHGHCIQVHGERSPEYKCWAAMRRRCLNKNSPDFPDYGGRGISICSRWSAFEAFLLDMGRRPSPAHSIDRMEVDGNYEPGNCRWATTKQQMRNKRSNHWITVNGVSRILVEWAEISGLRQETIRRRLARGWSAEDSVFKPLPTSGKGSFWRYRC